MIYLFFGEDQFTLKQAVAHLWETTVSTEARDFNAFKFEASNLNFSVDEVINCADAIPFLSDKRLVVVTGIAAKLGKGGSDDAPKPTAKSKGAKAPASPRERFLNFMARMSPTTVMILIESKVAKNDLIYKAVEKHGEVREFLPPKDLKLEKWVSDHAKKLGYKLEPNAATLLAKTLGSDLFRIDNELHKLAAYAGEGQIVTTKMVELLSVSQEDTPIFALTDALARRNYSDAVLQLNKMRQQSTQSRNSFARYVFNSVSGQVYTLLRIREMATSRKSEDEIAKTLGVHPFVVKKNVPQATKFSADRLEKLYHRLTELDYADKTGKADLPSQLDLVLAEICLS
jgi:DNA polymerase III subunit delta